MAPDLLDVHDIAGVPVEKMLAYDALDLTGKEIAIFGLGDQYGYPENYCDAIGILGRKFAAQGAELVGFTPDDGYEFSYSQGVEDGMFLGLALDEENETERTLERIAGWIWQLVDEFDLVHLLEPVMSY